MQKSVQSKNEAIYMILPKNHLTYESTGTIMKVNNYAKTRFVVRIIRHVR